MGGFFVLGTALYPDWTPKWSLDYTLQHSAILISANYRLLPASNGADILSDISSFYDWLTSPSSSGFASYLSTISPSHAPNLSQILTIGESAGGFAAIYAALTQPQGLIKAVIATYPYLREPKGGRTKKIFGQENVPKEVLEAFLKSEKAKEIVSSIVPPGRLPIALSIAQQGRKDEFLGDEQTFGVFAVLEKRDVREGWPKMVIFHGLDDTAVPVDGSVDFEAKVREKFGEGHLKLVLEKGEHGFDKEADLKETGWLKEGLEGIAEAWLGV